MGFAMLGLAGVLQQGACSVLMRQSSGDETPAIRIRWRERLPHFPAKAKRVIHLFMNGGPSHVDTFDPKPSLEKYAGKPLPMQNLATERKTGAAFPSPFKFQKYGQSGIEVSELFQHTAQHIDDIAVIRSMHADVPNHEPSLLLMNCGDSRLVRPSMGSWLTYGLGTENLNLPGFIAMVPGGYPIQETQNWQVGVFARRVSGDVRQHAASPRSTSSSRTSRTTGCQPTPSGGSSTLLAALNKHHEEQRGYDPALDARIHCFELAYRMQREAAEAFDVNREPKHVLEAYGERHAGPANSHRPPADRARRAFRASLARPRPAVGQPRRHRRQPPQARRPVRPGDRRANHRPQAARASSRKRSSSGAANSAARRPSSCRRPGPTRAKSTAATTTTGASPAGSPAAASKAGQTYGATDEFGFKAVEKPVHVHDLHATILSLHGLRPRTTHLPLRRPRFPADGRAWEGGGGIDWVTLEVGG